MLNIKHSLQHAAVAEANTSAAPVRLETNETVHPVAFKFSFKKDDLGNKRPTIELTLKCPTKHGVEVMLEDEKQTEYLLDVLEGEVYKQAREQVGDEVKPVNSQEELDESKLTMEYIANLPKAERRGGGIAKEVWAAFAADYISVMPALTGKNAEQIGNAAKLLTAKFQPIKTNKKVISFLKEQLGMWFTNTSNAEDFAEVYEFLDKKAETLLQADEAALLANL